jgi:predicted patatin/cPLA2 family phospholipase
MHSLTNTHPVIDLILSRAHTRSKPGARQDGAILGLVFEGGSMRGITSAGMGLALVQLGLTDVFDVVYGSSAGAFNGAYFVSRQGASGITVYYENINNRKFINLSRPLLGKPVVSLDYLFDVVMTSLKPLDYDAISQSPIPLRIVAANITLRKSTVFDHFQSRHDLLQKLKASAALPFLAGPPIEIDGEFYSDASLYESIPFRSAIQDAAVPRCTHVLVLRSRPDGTTRGPHPFLSRQFLGGALRRYRPELYTDFLRTPSRYSKDLEELSRCTNDPIAVPYVYQVVVPKGTPIVSSLERRRDVLVKAASFGMKAMILALTGRECTVMELITPLSPEGRTFTL